MFDFLEGLDGIWIWGIGLIFIFPLALVITNEVGYIAARRDKDLAAPIRTIKNIILPLIAVVLLLTHVLGFDQDSLSIKIVSTLIWVLVINAGISIITKFFFKGAKEGTWQSNVPQLFLDIFRIILVLFGGAVILSTVWGQELSGLVTALGLGSFVLGLALQDTLGNLFSGIALVYEKPFAVGDFIKVGDQTGKVIEMNWRAVHMRTRELELVVIPHLMIGQGVILNFSKPTKVHILQQEVGFSYGDPPNVVKGALLSTCLNTPGILHEPEPEVKTVDYADSAVVYEIEFAIEDFLMHEEIMDDLMTRIWYTAQRSHLTIPFPQRTVHYAETAPTTTEEHSKALDESIQVLPKFLPVKEEHSDLLKSGSKLLFFGKNEIIFSQGDPTGNLYVVMSGKVDLFSKNKSGQNVHLNTIHVGDIFGEAALMSGRTSSMTARAASDVKAMVIMQSEVMNIVGRNPSAAFEIGEAMETHKKTLKKKLEKN